MADRDIAAFGLFPDRASLERAGNLRAGQVSETAMRPC
jgi:hypothetical protein